MITEHTFNTDIVTINYAEAGVSGPPLILIHGGSARWQSSMPILLALSRQWHVYAPDLRGHGKSGWVPGHYQLKDYVADIAMFLENIIKEPAVLFGHSLGGHIAIMIAAWHRHLVRGLIIGDAPFDRTKLRSTLQRDQQRLLHWRDFAGPAHSLEEITEALKNTPIAIEGQSSPVPARTLFGEDNAWFRDMAKNLRLNDPEMLTAVIEFDNMHEEYDYEQLFPMIACPVLIIQGNPAHGGLLTNEEIEHALTLLPRITIARMETVGHPLHTQEKEPVLFAITSFLDTL